MGVLSYATSQVVYLYRFSDTDNTSQLTWFIFIARVLNSVLEGHAHLPPHAYHNHGMIIIDVFLPELHS